MVFTRAIVLGLFIVGIGCAPTESVGGDDRILHGTQAEPNKYPYHVSVQSLLEADPKLGILGGVHKFCGGVIIHEKYVLTAAQCFKNKAADKIYVKAGQVDAFNYSDPSQFIHVKSIHQHPDFTLQPDIVNDIALLELEKPFSWSSSVQKINMPDKSHVPQGKGQIIGYGETNNDANVTSRYLLEATVSAAKNSECTEFYKREITKKQACIGYGAKENACSGDIGGPFIQKQKKKPVVVGIYSTGLAGCNDYVPALYTRVNQYLDWINNTMKS